MNKEELNFKLTGLSPIGTNFSEGCERRGPDGFSWYDLSVNMNSLPCEADTAIIVTSWMGQLKWLKATLTQYRKSGAFVILAYDNPFYAWSPKIEHEAIRCLPNVQHLLLANSMVMKHITYDGDKRNGWFWDVRYAQGLLKNWPNIKYVYCTNGDCIWDRPEGLSEIKELLGDGDLISGQSDGSIIHTAAVLYKAEAFHRIFDQMAEWMRVAVVGSRSPEGMLREACAKLKINVVHAPLQPLDTDGTLDCYSRRGQDSTWRRILGYRNLFAEQEEAWNYGGEPIPKEYLDLYCDCIYFSGEEKETICQYYKTGDRRYLYKWWDCGEDSWYNRLYYPLTHYGKEPIYK